MFNEYDKDSDYNIYESDESDNDDGSDYDDFWFKNHLEHINMTFSRVNWEGNFAWFFLLFYRIYSSFVKAFFLVNGKRS